MNTNNKTISKLYLASKSPRRSELLKQIGIDFEIIAIDIPEEVQANENYRNYSKRICEEKSTAASTYIKAHNLVELPVLTADTEVIIHDEILGKAANYNEAFKMWKKLINNKHLVITTITLSYQDFIYTASSESLVYFDEVSDKEIHNYLATGDYKDKSGSYGIQSYAGQFIQRIDGCFYSIMGLPLNKLRLAIQKLELYLANR
jgi:septum formation protein